MASNVNTMKKLSILITTLLVLAFAPVMFAVATEPVKTSTEKPATNPDLAAQAELEKAVAEFNGLNKKDKKSRFKEVKKMIKDLKADKKAGRLMDADTNLILLAILAILLPPLAIYLKERALTWKFWVSLILILPIFFGGWFLWLAAVILALLVVFDAI